MLKGAKPPDYVRDMPQCRFTDRIDRASFLNLCLSKAKCELTHMNPQTWNRLPKKNGQGIRPYNTENSPSHTIKSLGVMIDQRLTFRVHAVAAAPKARKSVGFIARTTRKREASPGPIDHLLTTIAIQGLL